MNTEQVKAVLEKLQYEGVRGDEAYIGSAEWDREVFITVVGANQQEAIRFAIELMRLVAFGNKMTTFLGLLGIEIEAQDIPGTEEATEDKVQHVDEMESSDFIERMWRRGMTPPVTEDLTPGQRAWQWMGQQRHRVDWEGFPPGTVLTPVGEPGAEPEMPVIVGMDPGRPEGDQAVVGEWYLVDVTAAQMFQEELGETLNELTEWERGDHNNEVQYQSDIERTTAMLKVKAQVLATAIEVITGKGQGATVVAQELFVGAWQYSTGFDAGTPDEGWASPESEAERRERVQPWLQQGPLTKGQQDSVEFMEKDIANAKMGARLRELGERIVSMLAYLGDAHGADLTGHQMDMVRGFLGIQEGETFPPESMTVMGPGAMGAAIQRAKEAYDRGGQILQDKLTRAELGGDWESPFTINPFPRPFPPGMPKMPGIWTDETSVVPRFPPDFQGIERSVTPPETISETDTGIVDFRPVADQMKTEGEEVTQDETGKQDQETEGKVETDEPEA